MLAAFSSKISQLEFLPRIFESAEAQPPGMSNLAGFMSRMATGR